MRSQTSRTARTLMLLGVLATLPAESARADDVKLNFATVNQSQWTSGPAFVRNASLSIPDPALSGTVDLGKINMDPFSAAVDFIGDLLGINLNTGVSISPVASFSVGLEAGYHVNSGSLNLNYPTEIALSLPTEVDGGHSFTVSAGFPAPGGIAPYALPASSVASIVANAGMGYAGLGPFLGTTVGSVVEPTAGFSTQFPYAEAHLNLDLAASGALRAEACVIILGCDGKNLSVGGIDLSQQLFELNTLKGIQVLDQTVVPFNGTVDLPLGLGELSFNSPNVTVNGHDTGSNGSFRGADLRGDAANQFLQAGFDVEQLIPLVGQILRTNLGVIGYDLLSFDPTISLTINQRLTFTPEPMVDLKFNEPVLYNGLPTRDVVVPVGAAPVTLFPTSGGLSGDLFVSPTFFLNNTMHNETWVSVSLGYDISALALTAPVSLGPAFQDHVDFADFDFFQINDSKFQVYVPPITTAAVDIARSTGLTKLLQADFVGTETDPEGHPNYALKFANNLSATAFGGLVTLQPPNLSTPCQNFDFDACEHLFIADDDVFLPNADGAMIDQGRLFCLVCFDATQLLPGENPSMLDADGDPVYFARLDPTIDPLSVPALPTIGDILNSDPVMASSQYFQKVQVTPNDLAAVPEPGTLLLLGSGTFCMFRLKRKAVRR